MVAGCSGLFAECERVAMAFGIAGEQRERVDVDQLESRGCAHGQQQLLIGSIEVGRTGTRKKLDDAVVELGENCAERN